MNSSNRLFWLLISLSGALLVAFLVLPIIGLFWVQFGQNAGGFFSALTDPSILSAVGLSCVCACLSTLICFLLGTPLAYMLARKDFKGKGLLEGLIDLPSAVPHVVAGIMLVIVLGRGGWLGGLFECEGTVLGVVCAMLFVSAPFFLDGARRGFSSVDPRLENVARSLGASEWDVFLRISLPLAFPHLLGSALMSWGRALSEFAAVIMLVGFFPMIAPGLIWQRFYTGGLLSSLAASTLFLLVVLCGFVLTEWLRRRYARG